MGFVPTYDRLGAASTPGSNVRRAINGASPAVAANESLLVEVWVTVRDALYGWTGGNNWYWFYLTDGTTGHYIRLRRDMANGRMTLDANNGATQSLNATCLVPGDNYLAFLLDRDGTELAIFNNGTQVASVALANNPDLSNGGGNMTLMGAGNQHNGHVTFWRERVTTISSGNVPADWTDILAAQANPDAGLHPSLSAVKGNVASSYAMGEGLYGSSTITDTGETGGYNCTWNGENVEDVRVRARVPWSIPRRTFYTLTPGYTANVPATDFGFAVQPVVWRATFKNLANLTGGAHDIVTIQDAGATDIVRLRKTGTPTSTVYANLQGMQHVVCHMVGDQLSGGDMFIVCNGTTVTVYLNGQPIAEDSTFAAALDLSGNCVIVFNGSNECCRFAIWNPATVPGTLAQEIRDCAGNVDFDPPSLTSKLVDFPIRSDLVAAGGTTVANQGTGGGTLTLSAQRSTSCTEMLTGFNP